MLPPARIELSTFWTCLNYTSTCALTTALSGCIILQSVYALYVLLIITLIYMQCFSCFFTTLLLILSDSVKTGLKWYITGSKLYQLAFWRYNIKYGNNMLRCTLYCLGIVHSYPWGVKMTLQFVLLYLLR